MLFRLAFFIVVTVLFLQAFSVARQEKYRVDTHFGSTASGTPVQYLYFELCPY